jgi:hypothetical protein
MYKIIFNTRSLTNLFCEAIIRKFAEVETVEYRESVTFEELLDAKVFIIGTGFDYSIENNNYDNAQNSSLAVPILLLWNYNSTQIAQNCGITSDANIETYRQFIIDNLISKLQDESQGLTIQYFIDFEDLATITNDSCKLVEYCFNVIHNVAISSIEDRESWANCVKLNDKVRLHESSRKIVKWKELITDETEFLIYPEDVFWTIETANSSIDFTIYSETASKEKISFISKKNCIEFLNTLI